MLSPQGRPYLRTVSRSILDYVPRESLADTFPMSQRAGPLYLIVAIFAKGYNFLISNEASDESALIILRHDGRLFRRLVNRKGNSLVEDGHLFALLEYRYSASDFNDHRSLL
jgi:hypothetical protein